MTKCAATSRHAKYIARLKNSLAFRANQLCLIACHTWDILGASAAGWKTVLVLRTGNAELAVGGQPLMTIENLHEVAERLLQGHVN